MKRKKISAKVWASIMAAAMVMSTCPTAAFAVTADNLYVFTHLKGMDPQYSMTGGTTYVYTPSRTISFSVDVKF